MKKHFWAFAIIVALCTGFLAGVFLQYHQVPYRIKWSIIYAIQDISGQSRLDYSLAACIAKTAQDISSERLSQQISI